MAIEIIYKGGKQAGKVLHFGDELDQVVIGRDPEECQVVFNEERTIVGRQHCALRRELGRYRLLLNRDNPVRVNDELAHDGQELPGVSVLQLGNDGPKLTVKLILSDGANLPATAVSLVSAPGAHTLAVQASSQAAVAATRAHAGVVVAVAALGVLVVVLIFGLMTHIQTRHELNEAQDVSIQQQLLAAVQGRELDAQRVRNENLAKDLDETRGALAVARSQQDATDKRLDSELAGMAKQREAFAHVLERAQKSVYLVVGESKTNYMTATAWVVDRARGILATNAHVAESFDDPGMKLVVRPMVTSPNRPPTDLEVTDAWIHPGYALFQEMVAQQSTGQEDWVKRRQLAQLVGGPDIALLFVRATEALGEDLPLASPERQRALRGGVPLAYIGYPAALAGGFDIRYPVPLMQIGAMVSLSDHFLHPSDGQGQLLQVSMPVVGGASGSPVLTADGEVVGVVCSSQAITLLGEKISFYKGVDFAQRVDLVQEMLRLDRTKVGEFTEQVRARWEEDLEKHFGRQPLDDVTIDRHVRGHLYRWRQEDLYRRAELLSGVRVAKIQPRAELPGSPRGCWFEQLLPAGSYLLVAICPTRCQVGLTLYGDRAILAEQQPDQCEVAQAFTLDHPTNVRAFVFGRPPGTAEPDVSFRLFRTVREPIDAGIRLRVRDELLAVQLDQLDPGAQLQLVPGTPTTGLLGAFQGGKSAFRYTIAGPTKASRYCILAIAQNAGEDIDLIATDETSATHVASDGPDGHPSVIVKVEAGAPVKVQVLGATHDAAFDFWVFELVTP